MRGSFNEEVMGEAFLSQKIFTNGLQINYRKNVI